MELSSSTLEKVGLSAEGQSSHGIKRAPVYFRESVQGWDFPDLPQSYLNIYPYSEEGVSDEFIDDKSCALLFSEKNYNPKLKIKNIFFQPSLRMGDVKKKSLSQEETNIDLGLDPYSLALWKGELCSIGRPLEGVDIDRAGLKVFRFSTLAYDLAGATPIQQLSVLLSSTLQLLNYYEGTLSVEKILSLISYEVSLSNHVFMNIAKLQSLRQMLYRFYEVLGVETVEEPQIYATPSPRYFATREPWNNILRLTSMSFSASAGGAQGFMSLPFDLLSQKTDKRLSRNNFMILDQESFVNKVSFPSLGSGLSEDLTSQFCQKSWTFFREIEKKEGLLGVIQSGWLQKEIEVEHENERKRFLSRETKMIGVNEFALTRSLSKELPLVASDKKQDIDRWWIDYITSEGSKKLSDVQRLKPYQLSQDFEKWQFLADKHMKKNNQAMKVSIYCEDEKVAKTKLALAEKLMALAGIEVDVCEEDISQVENVCFFIAADPEGEPVVKALENYKAKGCKYAIWVGERAQTHFDDFLGHSSDLMKVYDKIFKVYGVVL
jgi:hypothetical protein